MIKTPIKRNILIFRSDYVFAKINQKYINYKKNKGIEKIVIVIMNND